MKSIDQDSAKDSITQEAYSIITELIHIDNTFVSGRKKQRQLVLSEKVDAYFVGVKQKYSQLTHNSTISKALAHSINLEDYLRVFLSDGYVPMDNNYAEQAVRPFTIDRKNFVLIKSSTAKTNMVNTFEYFSLLLTEIPQHMKNKDLRFLDTLLSGALKVQKEYPSKYKNLNQLHDFFFIAVLIF